MKKLMTQITCEQSHCKVEISIISWFQSKQQQNILKKRNLEVGPALWAYN